MIDRTDATHVTAVPVALVCGPPHDDAVRRWVEGILGWQPVDDDPDGPVPPVVRLVDVTSAVAHPATGGAVVPTLLLVDERGDGATAARAAVACGASGIVAWPGDRERLGAIVTALVAAPRRTRTRTRTVRVGGAAGGVGTTTVALALAGLRGWAGTRTLVVVGERAPVRVAPAVPATALAGAGLWARAAPLAGVPEVRVVSVRDGPVRDGPVDPAIGLAVVDAGVDGEVDVLVCRPDGPGLAAVPDTSAGAVVVVGDGPVAAGRLRAVAGGRRVVGLATSARVQRAHLRALVPTALPGRWLAALEGLVDVAGP